MSTSTEPSSTRRSDPLGAAASRIAEYGADRASVIVCAYTADRWDDVLAAVSSIQAQGHKPHEIILVVDHNPDLFRRLAAELPEVTVMPNTGPKGLSGAKNSGLAAATGDFIMFLDDDAVAEHGWLAALTTSFVDPTVLGVGGLTLPAWTTGRPCWWPGEFDWVIGCTFIGRDPGEVRNLLGGNASFRRDIFGVVGGFPTSIGRTSKDTRPLGCEETEFCIRARSKIPGGRFVFNDGAIIRHRVPAAREQFSYFRSRCYAEGISKAMVAQTVGRRAGLEVERSYAATVLRRGVLRGLRDAARGDIAGLQRAGAIVVGLAYTVAGFATGTWQHKAGGST